MSEEFPMVDVDEETEKRAQKLHSESIVVNSCDTSEWDEDYVVNRLGPSGVNVTVPTMASQFDYKGTGADLSPWFAKMRTFDKYLMKATSYADIEKALAAGKIAVIFAFQSAKPLDDNLDLLDIYYEMGVRVLQITYNYRGMSGDGCLESYDGGLSDWGARLVERMNKLGMLIDLSHASAKTSADVLEISTQPVIFSHSNCKALVNNPRNIDDNLIHAIQKKNGYIGINVLLSMVSEHFHSTPSLDEVLDHVDHISKTIGPSYVGFGLDRAEGMTREKYQSFGFPPDSYPSFDDAMHKHAVREIKSVRQFINLTRMLVKRGYSDSEVRNILGGNFLRVFKQVAG
jgi:membrane dipeptidase